jgi:protein-tyrosine phosphatase
LCEDPVNDRNSKINYLHLPITDDAPIEAGRFDQIIDALYENIRWGTVLLHCLLGSSRGPIMAA